MSIWTFLLVGALIGASGSAFANGFVSLDDDSVDVGIVEDKLLHDVDVIGSFGNAELLGECDNGVGAVGDTHREAVEETTFRQDVDVDEDDVLLAIALANNGASGITWNKIRDFRSTETATRSADFLADLDRNDVFNALALGVDASSGALEALACISDITFDLTVERTVSQRTDLDETEVLLAIALSNSVGGSLVFEDIADIDLSDRTRLREDRTFDLDRDDAFLSLSLGAGGNGATL